jgi:putative signal transducing protein
LMMLMSLLESEGITYRIQNEHFGGLYPGLNIFALNERIILVDESDYERAWLVTRDFREAMEQPPKAGSISTIHRPGCLPQNTDNGA